MVLLGLPVLIEMPRFSLGMQTSLWLLSFRALSSFPCAITKTSQVWIPLLPPSFNRLMSCWAWGKLALHVVLHGSCSSFKEQCSIAWDTLSSYLDCSESLALISKALILWNMEGHLLRQYKMIKDKAKLFYGRWGSASYLLERGKCGAAPHRPKSCMGTMGMVPPAYTVWASFPPKIFLCTMNYILFMSYDCLEGCGLNFNEFLSKRNCENKCNSASLLSSPSSGSLHPPHIRAIT